MFEEGSVDVSHVGSISVAGRQTLESLTDRSQFKLCVGEQKILYSAPPLAWQCKFIK